MKDSALYIHIPFCDHKCVYCDFYSIITSDNILAFLSALKKEIKNYSKIFSDDRIFTSIFFGGGTPSLMEPEFIKEIIDSLKENYNISKDVEITLETNPGTVDKKKLSEFKNIGINRLSIGIQSFDDDDLKFLTRIHNEQTAVETIKTANKIGYENINIDLIFNLPKQTKAKWMKNLVKAVELPIKHISAYSLILERGTILNKMVLDGKVKIQDDDYDAELYELTIDVLEDHNFIQYEVSNFCKSGFECRHNNAYWHYNDYLSFGPSSHSFINNKRWWNFSSLKRYIIEIEKNGFAIAGSEMINDEMALREYVMLALRSDGLKLNDFGKRFGEDWINQKHDYLKKLSKQNLVLIDGTTYRLTKKGYAICDEILASLL